jgi:hypothetical protein
VLLHFRLLPFIFMFIKLGFSFLSLNVLLNQTTAFGLYSLRLMFLHTCTSLACLACINLTFMDPCIVIQIL